MNLDVGLWDDRHSLNNVFFLRLKKPKTIQEIQTIQETIQEI